MAYDEKPYETEEVDYDPFPEGKPLPAKAKPAAKSDKYDTEDVDYDPFPEDKKAKKDEGQWEVTKGFRKGLGGTAETGAAAARAGSYELGATEKEAKEGYISSGLEKLGKAVSGEEEVAVPSVADIGWSPTKAFQYVMQNIGQAAGSSLAPLISGGLGAAAGSVVAPGVGTVAGGVAGAAASGIPLGIGTMFKALEDDKEIQELVKSGKTTWKDIATTSLPYGVAIGSLDVVGEAALARIAGLHNIGKDAAKKLVTEEVKEKVKYELLRRAGKGAAEGAVSEGATEGAQQAIQEFGVAERGGQADVKKSAISILDSVLGGIIGGGAAGAAGGALHREKKGLNEEGSPKTGAEDQEPGKTGTGTAHPEAPITPDASTPGGNAPGPAAQPAGAAIKQTETAPKAPPVSPVAGVGEATPPAQMPPVGGVADPSLQAGLSTAIGEGEESDLTEEQEAIVAKRRPPLTQGVTDPDAALALQGIAGAAEAPQPQAAAPAPIPAAEPPAAPATPPGGPPPPAAVQPPAPPAVQPAEAAAAPSVGPAPVAGEQVAGAAAVPTEQPQTIPESEATLAEQRKQLISGDRKAVLYPKGTKPGKLPKGMKSVTVPKIGTFHFNDAQILKEEVVAAAREDRINEVLGLGPFNKAEVAATPGPEMAVAERTPQGVEVRAAGATPITAPIQQAAMEAGKTPGNIVAPEPIDQTLARRAAEAPAPAAAEAVQPEPAPAPVPVEPAPSPAPAPAAPVEAPKAAKAEPKKEAPPEAAPQEKEEKAPEAPSVRPSQTALTVTEPSGVGEKRAAIRKHLEETLAHAREPELVKTLIEEKLAKLDKVLAKHTGSVGQAVIQASKMLTHAGMAKEYQERLGKLEEQRAQEEAEKTIAAHKAAQEEDIEARKGKRGQRRKDRVTVQSPLEIDPEDAAARTPEAFVAMVRGLGETAEKKGQELPPYFKRALEAIEKRNKVRGVAREKFTATIDEAKDDWVRAVEKNEAEEQAKKPPAPSIEEEVEEQKAADELTPEERAIQTEEIRQRDVIAKATADPQNAQARAAVEKHMPIEVLASGDGDRILAAAKQAATELGPLPKKLLDTNPPWMNFLAWVNRRKTLGPQGMSNVLIGYADLKEGKVKDFYEFAKVVIEGQSELDTEQYLHVFAPERTSTGRRVAATTGMKEHLGEAAGLRPAEQGSPDPTRDGDTLTNWQTGESYTLRPEDRMTGKEALQWARPIRSDEHGGLFRLMDKGAREELAKLAADVPVYFVPAEELARLHTRKLGPGQYLKGLYSPPSLEAAARGEKGVVMIADDGSRTAGDLSRQMSHTLKHELTHAVTAWAYSTNYQGFKHTLDGLHAEAVASVRAAGLNPKQWYGFTNGEEMLSEAMSNPDFQQMLSELTVSNEMAQRVRALSGAPGSKPTVWRLFTAAVTRLLNLAGFGQQGMTYTEALLRTFEGVSADTAARREHFASYAGTPAYQQPGHVVSIGPKGAEAMRGGRMTDDQLLSAIYDRELLGTTVKDTVEALKVRASTDLTTTGRLFRDKYLSNTFDLRRRAERLLKGAGDAGTKFLKAIDAFLATDHTRGIKQKVGDEVAARLNTFIRKFPEAGKELTRLFHEGTRVGVDFTEGPSGARNAYFNNQDPKFIRQRTEHAKLSKAYQKLIKDQKHGAEAKGITEDAVKYYAKMQNDVIDATVKKIMEAAAGRPDVSLPAGENLASVTQWVKSGEIDRGLKKQTDRDKALHKSLGKVVEALQKTTSVRDARGVYTPLTRRGNFAVTASKNLENFETWVPEDQQQKGVDYLPKGAEAIDENTLRFDDRAAYEAYARSTNDQWVDDPRIKTTKGSFDAFVQVQTHYLEFFDRHSDAKARRQELIDTGAYKEHADRDINEISQVQHRRDKTQDAFEQELTGRQVDRLLNSIQQVGVKDGAYNLAKRAIIQTQIQSMSGNRAQHRKIKRKFTHGEAQDMVKAMRDYNTGASSYLANMEQMPKIQAGLDALNQHLKDHPGDRDFMRKQEVLTEIKRRLKDTGEYRNNGLLRTFVNISYLNHLASFAFLGMQYMQPMYSTFPVLAARFGGGRSRAEIFNAMGRLGAGGIYAKGWTESVKALRDQETTDPIAAMLARKELTALDRDTILALQQMGLLDREAGQEDVLRRLNDNKMDRLLAPANRFMSHITNSIEAMNRAMTGLAAAKLYMDKHPTHSREQAIQHAVYAVEETQFGYGKANAPPIFSHPLARVALQFKKYALGIGNYLARQIYAGFNVKPKDAQARLERTQALKSLAWMFATYAAFSGLSGGLPWELIKVPLMVIGFLIGKKELGEWDRMMNLVQGSLAGTVGKGTAEVIMRGLPRMLGIDLSNRINLSSLALFGDPKDQKTDSLKSWLFDLFAGAPTSMVLNSIDAMKKGDLVGAVPGPKIIKDVLGAFKGSTEGKIVESGRQVSKPFSPTEAVTKALGLRTAREAEQWEYGGSGFQSKEDKRIKDDRSALANAWHKADTLKDTDGKAAAWKKIQAWNKEHPDQIIKMEQLTKAKERRASEDKKMAKKLATTQ